MSGNRQSRLFSELEHYIIIGEIGRMQGLSFGEALELLDSLFGGAIISPGGLAEPVDPGYLGCLICQVGTRQDISHQERRVLMYKLAVAGLGVTLPKGERSVLERVYHALRVWIGQSGGSTVCRTGEPCPSDGEFEEVERLVQNVADCFTSQADERDPPPSYRSSGKCLIRDPGWEFDDERLNRTLLGNDDLYGVTGRPRKKKKKNPIHDDDESGTLDSRFSNWFWGDYEG